MSKFNKLVESAQAIGPLTLSIVASAIAWSGGMSYLNGLYTAYANNKGLELYRAAGLVSGTDNLAPTPADLLALASGKPTANVIDDETYAELDLIGITKEEADKESYAELTEAVSKRNATLKRIKLATSRADENQDPASKLAQAASEPWKPVTVDPVVDSRLVSKIITKLARLESEWIRQAINSTLTKEALLELANLRALNKTLKPA